MVNFMSREFQQISKRNLIQNFNNNTFSEGSKMKNQHLLTSQGVSHKNEHNQNKNTLARADLTPLSAEGLSLRLSVRMGTGVPVITEGTLAPT